MLESTKGLSFAPGERIPFCYHLDPLPGVPLQPGDSAWPTGVPPGGYTTDTREILPSTLAVSLKDGWWNHTLGAFTGRTFKVALWQTKVAGIHSALTLAFDLHRAGFASTDDLFETIRLLLHGRSRTTSDDEMVAAFLGHEEPDPLSWRFIVPETAWLESGRARVHESVIDLLLARGMEEIDYVRKSADYDEWRIGQAQLFKLLLIIQRLIMEFWGADRLPLAWRAKLGHWEEIGADALGVVGLALIPGGSLPTWRGDDARRMDSVMEQYRARGGGNWRSRFLRERLLVPDALRDQVLEGCEGGDLPDEWRWLSRSVVRPWMAAFRSSVRPDRWRPEPCPAEDLVDDPDVRAAFQKLGVSDRAEKLRMIRAYFDGSLGKSSSRPRPTTRKFVGDNGIPSVYMNLGLPKRSAEEENVLIALNEVLPEVEQKYIDREMKEDIEAETWLRTYPYCQMALQKSYFQFKHRGDVDQAMERLIDGVVLEPTLSHTWRQLAELLDREGHEDEASTVTYIEYMWL
ncbi:hypothetical protein ACFVZC_04645 [Streptomyces marokkonensis]|uniref:Uncharacterized protein n=1 Tax=Streptomyces marokkonensis TaxID=324855 RepID=A0ABW6Q0I9_9ACTN